MWARPTGANLYEIVNVPFYAYDLNYLDVVEAVEESPDKKPQVRRVVRRSGHRTIRLMFDEQVPVQDRVPLLESLKKFRADFEGATEALFALNIEPSGDYQAVRGQLDEWVKDAFL